MFLLDPLFLLTVMLNWLCCILVTEQWIITITVIWISLTLKFSDIADVTNFVHPGTPLDDEASQRGTSVYLVERRIDMLPKPLTEGLNLSAFVTTII